MDAAVNPLLAALDSSATDALLVRVVSLRGFGLRDAADGVVVSASGQLLGGSLLGGLADDDLAEEAAKGDGRRPARFTVTDRDADAAGMVCGGVAHVLFTPVGDLPDEIGELLQRAEPLALVGAADGSGGDLVVTRKEAHGELGVDIEAHHEQLLSACREQLAAGSTATSTIEIAGTSLVISTVVPATKLLIVGSGPMAEAIAAQGRLMGWTTTIDESLDAGIAFVTNAGPADGVAVISHDSAVDVPILDAALGSSIGYIGGMGSRGTQTRRRKQLGERGHRNEVIDRIHGPIGLDLGSRTPAETAVAIAAEFLANRSGRQPGSLRGTAGPING